jgi:hypothetical protein
VYFADHHSHILFSAGIQYQHVLAEIQPCAKGKYSMRYLFVLLAAVLLLLYWIALAWHV